MKNTLFYTVSGLLLIVVVSLTYIFSAGTATTTPTSNQEDTGLRLP